MNISQQLKGILITTLGVIILSPDALLIRLLHADTWTVVFWRGLVFGLGICILMFIIYRRNTFQQFEKIGKPGIAIGLIFGFSSIFFTTAVQNTSISNTLVIISTSPVFAALFSWIYLKEKVPFRTWLTMFIIFIAIAAILYNGFQVGGTFGDISAMGTAILIAISFTFTRKYKEVNMVPAMAISGIVAITVSSIVAISTHSSLKLEADAIPYLIIAGFVVTIAFALITLGPRYITAPEVSLIMPLETVLGTYLGWIFLKEIPSNLTIIGGVVVILALAIHAWLSLKANKYPPGKIP
jgi:drug/metabolite transporter (DMT)-like permease